MILERRRWQTISIVATCLLTNSAAIASSELVFTDEIQGCFHHERVVTIFDRHPHEYTSPGCPDQSVDAVRDLISIIESSTAESCLNLESLGITPETVKKHQTQMLLATLRGRDYVSPKIATQESRAFEFPALSKLVKARLSWHDTSTTHRQFSVIISDPAISKEKIEVASTHDCPWMLPWRVQVGHKIWNTYSTALPLKLASFADKRGPCASLLDGRHYWNEGFWADSDFWSIALGPRFEQASAKDVAQTIPGYNEAAKFFEIDGCNIGSVNMQPQSLFLKLKCRHPQVFSSVWWWNYLSAGKTAESWTQMLDRFQACENAARKQHWLLDWKANADNHSLRCNIAGASCYSETNITDFVLPAWRDAHMYGVPEVEVSLMRGDRWCGTVYLSSSEARAIVVHADPGTGSHWFDRRDFISPENACLPRRSS